MARIVPALNHQEWLQVGSWVLSLQPHHLLSTSLLANIIIRFKLMVYLELHISPRNLSVYVYVCVCVCVWMGFPHGSDSKQSSCNAGDSGLIPGLGRSPGEGNGYPLQYSCLENSIDRGAWQATVHGVSKSWK